MKLKRPFVIYLVLLLLAGAALSCKSPFLSSAEQPASTSIDIDLAVSQTIAAQELSATQTALVEGVSDARAAQDATMTANAQFMLATQADLVRQATENASAAQSTAAAQIATATAQSLQATISANSAQATAFSQALTATALSGSSPEMPPPPPPPPPGQSGIRISFVTGATSAVVEGQIKKNQTIDYFVRAGKGQTLLANVYSPGDNVFLGLAGVSTGNIMLKPASGKTSFQGVLPATQDYRISLLESVQKTNYTLQVIIPARIQFSPGAISAKLDGFLRGGETNFYLLQAKKNQTMTVTINSPHNDIFLTIYGMEDGSPLVRSVMAQTSWSGVLPRTQDYMIEAVSTGGNASYTIKVVIQ